jgi:hypothetical protein
LDLGFNSYNRYLRAVVLSFAEFNNAVGECEERPVFTNAYVLTRMVYGAALTYEDVTGNGGLTTEDLNAEALALGVAAVLYGTFTFLMCHDLKEFGI